MKSIYLDHAATTPTDPEVVHAMLPFFTRIYGNPSSMHAFGQEAKRAIEAARDGIASFLGAKPEEIIFTSGGTESNNFILKGIAASAGTRGNHIITSAIEHHAVLESCHYLEKQGFQVTYLPVDRFGLINPDDVKKAITEKTLLISIMHANNEIGTMEPVAEIGRIARERGVPFHTDAVQTFGHLPINVNELNIDALSASAHKFYGPKGGGHSLSAERDPDPVLHARGRAGKKTPGINPQCHRHRRFWQSRGTGGRKNGGGSQTGDLFKG